MIDSVNILIYDTGKEYKYMIDFNNLAINYNGITKRISRGTIFKLVSFFTSWKEEYSSDEILDGEEFFVEVIAPDGIKKYHGKGKYPKNYHVFKSFLGGIR